jgi:hypothetical protein
MGMTQATKCLLCLDWVVHEDDQMPEDCPFCGCHHLGYDDVKRLWQRFEKAAKAGGWTAEEDQLLHRLRHWQYQNKKGQLGADEQYLHPFMAPNGAGYKQLRDKPL